MYNYNKITIQYYLFKINTFLDAIIYVTLYIYNYNIMIIKVVKFTFQ